MAAIFQATFINAFFWLKMYTFRLRFHRSLFPRAQLSISQHCLRQSLGTGQATRHDLKQYWLVYWRTYASFGLMSSSAFRVRAWGSGCILRTQAFQFLLFHLWWIFQNILLRWHGIANSPLIEQQYQRHIKILAKILAKILTNHFIIVAAVAQPQLIDRA